MRKTLTLLLASTAMTAAIGLPAWSAIQSLDAPDAKSVAVVVDARSDAPAAILASNDDDDDDRRRSGRDDDDEDDDDNDDDEDDEERAAGARNPAPLGAVPPPANGLFGNGAPPRVQVN